MTSRHIACLARRMRVSLVLALALFVILSACGEERGSPSTTTSLASPGAGEPHTEDAGAAPIDAAASPPVPDAEAPDAAPPVWVTTTNETMTFAGLTRTYLLSVPRTQAGKRLPLVLVFHGNPGTAAGMYAAYPFDSASRDGAVIAYPQAAANDNWDLYRPLAENADMDFVRALVTEIATKANIDPARVLGHGFSGGAFFVAQMACRMGGVFRAISVQAGGGPDEPLVPGAPRHPNQCIQCAGGPVPTLVVHGAADTNVVPESGDFTAKCFATTNGCTGERSGETPCRTYAGCPSSAPVAYCPIPGLGHALWEHGSEKAWTFFTSLP